MRSLSLFFVLFFSFHHAWAGEEPEITHARPGFGMRPKIDAWSQVTVYLTNPSQEGKDVEVVVVSQDLKAGTEKVFSTRPVYLAPQSQRHEKFYSPFGGAAHFGVELYHKGQRIDRDTFPVKGIESNKPVFLIADDMHGSYSFLSKLKIPDLNEMPVPVYTHPRELPEKWIGYNGISVVILGSFNQEDLNEFQVEALKKWIASGGRLIIASDGRFGQYQNNFIEEMLDVEILGIRKVTSLPAMSKYSKSPIQIDEGMLFTEVYPENSEIILSQGQLPLILTSPYGIGKVIFLSFNPFNKTLTNWSGQARLWGELIGEECKLFPEENTTLAQNIEPILTEVVGVSVPGLNKVLISLMAYMAIIISSYLIFRYRKRPELSWLIYPVIVPLAIWIFYQMGQVGKGEFNLSVNEISLTELSPGEREGRSLGYLGFFSPRGLTTSLIFNNATVFGPRVSRAMPEKPLFKVIDVKEEDVFTLRNINLSPGALQTLSFNNITRLGDGLEAEMLLTEEGLVGEITNRTGQILNGCLLVYNRYVKPVGSISPGETINVQMNDPSLASWKKDYSQRAISSQRDVTKEKIISSLFTLPLLAKPAKPRLIFFGWLSNPAFNIDAAPKIEKKDALALVFMNVPIGLGEAGTIFIPKGICDANIADKASAGLFFQGKWLRVQREGTMTMDFVLPSISHNIIGQEIKVYFQFESADTDIKLDIYNWGKKQWKAFTREKEIKISRAEPYLASGKVRVRVRGKPLREKTSEGLPVGYWEIKDLDVELKGLLSKEQ